MMLECLEGRKVTCAGGLGDATAVAERPAAGKERNDNNRKDGDERETDLWPLDDAFKVYATMKAMSMRLEKEEERAYREMTREDCELQQWRKLKQEAAQRNG
jgi:hypothetical protein